MKNIIKNQSQKFRQKFKEAKSKPRYKPKLFAFGFTAVLTIFGITLLTPAVTAVAKNISNQSPKPTGPIGIATASPPSVFLSQELVNGLSGIAAFVCALAVTCGSFVVGAACGIMVVYGILKAQGK